jgi:hypothetical protein
MSAPRGSGRSPYVRAPRKWKEPDRDEGADKGAVFGQQHWPAPDVEGRCPGAVVVTEAALDALAVERATFHRWNVAAVYGSEVLAGHANPLSTFEEVVVVSEPDEAGDKLWRELRVALGRWTKLRRAELPEGYDASALAEESLQRLRCVLAFEDTTRCARQGV